MNMIVNALVVGGHQDPVYAPGPGGPLDHMDDHGLAAQVGEGLAWEPLGGKPGRNDDRNLLGLISAHRPDLCLEAFRGNFLAGSG